MIHYELQCGGDHRFDGWFRDSLAFDQQAQSGLLECPTCGDARVRRALMAPRLGRQVAAPQTVAAEPKPAERPGPDLPDEARAALQKLRADVESRCVYVADRFAEEARRIHRGESPAAAIYGEASPAEAEALADEGIEVARIPWVPRAES